MKKRVAKVGSVAAKPCELGAEGWHVTGKKQTLKQSTVGSGITYQIGPKTQI